MPRSLVHVIISDEVFNQRIVTKGLTGSLIKCSRLMDRKCKVHGGEFSAVLEISTVNVMSELARYTQSKVDNL